MQKTYERPVLATEPFDAEDVITVSAPDTPRTLDSANNNFAIDNIPLGDITIH